MTPADHDDATDRDTVPDHDETTDRDTARDHDGTTDHYGARDRDATTDRGTARRHDDTTDRDAALDHDAATDRGTRVGDVACGRSGDKGSTLDLTVVAADPAAYERLRQRLTEATVAERIGAAAATRYEVPGLLALKFVLPGALDAGPLASTRAGVHWQKAAISALLSLPLEEPTTGGAPAQGAPGTRS